MMKRYDARDFARRLREALLQQQEKECERWQRHASVAAILRMHKLDLSKEEHQVEKNKLELLFVRRTIRKRDAWSGQMAFPGGKANVGEEAIQAAKRETMEEIGMDLNTNEVECWGQLPVRHAHTSLSVSTFVFFHQNAQDFQPTLQKEEVSDLLWVDVALLADTPQVKALQVDLFDLVPSLHESWLTQQILRILRLESIAFPAIYLPRPTYTMDLTTSSATSAKPSLFSSSSQQSSSSSLKIPCMDTIASVQQEEKKKAKKEEEQEQDRSMHDFVLWGLTLSMVSDLARLGGRLGLPQVRGWNNQRIYYLRGALKLVDSSRKQLLLVSAVALGVISCLRRI